MEFSPYKFHSKFFTFYEKLGLSFVTFDKSNSAKTYCAEVRPAIIADSTGVHENLSVIPRVLLGNKTSLIILSVHFFLHYAFTVVRAVQYTFQASKVQVWVTSSWSWVWVATMGFISYLTFHLHKERINEFLAQWRKLDIEIAKRNYRGH